MTKPKRIRKPKPPVESESSWARAWALRGQYFYTHRKSGSWFWMGYGLDGFQGWGAAGRAVFKTRGEARGFALRHSTDHHSREDGFGLRLTARKVIVRITEEL